MQRMWMAAMAMVAACGAETPTDTVLALDPDVANGEAQYTTLCSTCHGANGEGVVGLGAPLAGTTLSEEEIVEVVLNGNTEGMASAELYGLSDQDVRDVTEFVLTGL